MYDDDYTTSSQKEESEWLDRGIVYHLDENNLTQAQILYRQVVSANPFNAKGWFLLGVCAYQEERYDDARLCTEKAMELRHPDTPNEWFCNLAEMYRKLHRRREAEMHARTCHEAINSEYSRLVLGWIYADDGQYDNAIKLFRQVCELNPVHIEALAQLGTE
jgi:tetratricopeptide (TPR) repeat protein